MDLLLDRLIYIKSSTCEFRDKEYLDEIKQDREYKKSNQKLKRNFANLTIKKHDIKKFSITGKINGSTASFNVSNYTNPIEENVSSKTNGNIIKPYNYTTSKIRKYEKLKIFTEPRVDTSVSNSKSPNSKIKNIKLLHDDKQIKMFKNEFNNLRKSLYLFNTESKFDNDKKFLSYNIINEVTNKFAHPILNKINKKIKLQKNKNKSASEATITSEAHEARKLDLILTQRPEKSTNTYTDVHENYFKTSIMLNNVN